MLPDSNWLNALKLPTQVVIGVFIACIVLIAFDWKNVIELKQFGEVTKPIVIVIAVLAGSLSLTGIIDFFKNLFISSQKLKTLVERRQIREKEEKNKRDEFQKATLKRLEHLSCEEISYLANCLRKGNQSFLAYFHSSHVATLISKGLVFTPGGQYNRDNYPFIIDDFVWEELLKRKDEFQEKQANCEREDEEQKKKERFRR